MALDISLLSFLSPLITFLLIWGIVFAILEKSKLLKGSTQFHAFIGFVIGLLFSFTPKAVTFIQTITPWMVVLFVVIILILVLFLATGWTEHSFQESMGEPVIRWTLIIIILIILFASLIKVFAPVSPVASGESSVENGETDSGAVGEEVRKALFSPKILGAVFLLIIAAFAIRFLSSSAE